MLVIFHLASVLFTFYFRFNVVDAINRGHAINEVHDLQKCLSTELEKTELLTTVRKYCECDAGKRALKCGNGIGEDTKAFLRFKRESRLSEVIIEYAPDLVEVDLGDFGGIENLVSLTVTRSGVKTVIMTSTSLLRKLDLSFNSVEEIKTTSFPPFLESLNLSSNSVGFLTPKLTFGGRLRILDLGNNSLNEDIDPRPFRSLSSLALQHLDISGTTFYCFVRRCPLKPADFDSLSETTVYPSKHNICANRPIKRAVLYTVDRLNRPQLILKTHFRVDSALTSHLGTRSKWLY